MKGIDIFQDMLVLERCAKENGKAIAMTKLTSAQNYPRIENENDAFHGYLDDTKLQPHGYKLSDKSLKQIVLEAIKTANKKASRRILNISQTASESEVRKEYEKQGKMLFDYFMKYCEDPASTAFQCFGRHFKEVASEQFRNRTLQKERMNSGWRYQFIAKKAAEKSRRFATVSDIGTAEADFNATINIIGKGKQLNIYVSVKNRTNTMGGQDWPKAIRAMEDMAKDDKNRNGPYICVFGIAMERGQRHIKTRQKTKQPYSVNTEMWLSDFFWPFFSTRSYKEIISAVLNVLFGDEELLAYSTQPPEELLQSFGECCRQSGLVDPGGKFDNAYKLAELFCTKREKNKVKKRAKAS